MSEVLMRMTGEELLLLRILQGGPVAAAVGRELDRRALHGTRMRPRPAGRTADLRTLAVTADAAA